MRWLFFALVTVQQFFKQDALRDYLTPQNVAENIFAYKFPQFALVERVFKPIEALEAILLVANSDKVVPESCVKQSENCPDDATEDEFMECLTQSEECKSDLEKWHDDPEEPPEIPEPIQTVAFTEVVVEGPGVVHYVTMVLVAGGCCAALVMLYLYKIGSNKTAKKKSEPKSIQLKTLKENFPFP